MTEAQISLLVGLFIGVSFGVKVGLLIAELKTTKQRRD